MAEILTQEQIAELLDKIYDTVLNGVPAVLPKVSDLADDYLKKGKSVEGAAKSLAGFQALKCGVSGFVTGLGGFITLPVAIPTNVASVLYIQLRMISAIAYMGGYDIKSDQVQTLVYACLAGISVANVVKQAGIKIGEKVFINAVKKIPGSVLTKINQKVGFRLITKMGEKGIINIGKGVPLVGGFIGGGFDVVETRMIADRAYKMFILNDSNDEKGTEQAVSDDEIIDIDSIDTLEVHN